MPYMTYATEFHTFIWLGSDVEFICFLGFFIEFPTFLVFMVWQTEHMIWFISIITDLQQFVSNFFHKIFRMMVFDNATRSPLSPTYSSFVAFIFWILIDEGCATAASTYSDLAWWKSLNTYCYSSFIVLSVLQCDHKFLYCISKFYCELYDVHLIMDLIVECHKFRYFQHYVGMIYDFHRIFSNASRNASALFSH